MEKFVLILAATALTANEAQGGGFQLSANEAWQMGFVLLAALLTSLSNESSKRRDGERFVPARFWGAVGLGVMAGLCIPLLLTAAFEHFTKTVADWRASVGLGILGAYIGPDALKAAWTAVTSLTQLVAKLKGLSISFDPTKAAPPDAEKPAPPAGPPAAPPNPPRQDTPGGDGHV